MSKNSYVIAVSMIGHGMNMVVKSNTKFVDPIVKECIDWVLDDREDASKTHGKLKKKLLKEDKFFNKFPKAASAQEERWNNFCNDCIIYVALNVALFNQPIHLIHPDQYKQGIKNSQLNLASKGDLDLIPGLEVVREAA